MRLYRNEAMRVFYDRLISVEDQKLVSEGLINPMLKEAFQVEAESVRGAMLVLRTRLNVRDALRCCASLCSTATLSTSARATATSRLSTRTWSSSRPCRPSLATCWSASMRTWRTR